MKPYCLTIAAELENLAVIRCFVQESAAALGVPPATIRDLVLATDEAATNIVVHGYGGQGGTIEIEIEREAGALIIYLRDTARPFDPNQIKAPDLTLPLEERTPGGLGVFLIRQIVDELRHRSRPGGGNELTLVKKEASWR